MKTIDTQVIELLSHLKGLLMEIQGSDSAFIKEKLLACSPVLEALKVELEKSTNFAYEFYEETARIVSIVSSLRIDPVWIELIDQLNAWVLLNEIVNHLAQAVYQHDYLARDANLMGKIIDWEKISILKLQEYMPIMENTADNSRKEADEALKEAEKFLDIMPEKLAQMQDSDMFLGTSMEIVKIMYVKNAAAAIATDRSIAVRQFFLNKAHQL